MRAIRSLAELEALYGTPNAASTVKVTDHLTDHYRAFVAASPFVALSTAGDEGADCSPRGDRPGFVRVADPRTLLMPDRRGNNRCDSLRNIVTDGRVGLLFLVPGSGTTLRVNGRAVLCVDPELCASFAVGGAAPRSVIVVTVEAVYFQCARAIVRSKLWDAAAHADPRTLPTPGAILAALSDGAEGGDGYDREWPERAAEYDVVTAAPDSFGDGRSAGLDVRPATRNDRAPLRACSSSTSTTSPMSGSKTSMRTASTAIRSMRTSARTRTGRSSSPSTATMPDSRS